jgi:hypothetical protein
MCVDNLTLVWRDAPYSGNTLLVLLALADWSGEDGYCWPKVASVAKKARMSVRAAQCALSRLMRDSAIELVTESPGSGAPRKYRLGVQYVHPSGESRSRSLHPTGADSASARVQPEVVTGADSRIAIRKNRHEPSVKATVSRTVTVQSQKQPPPTPPSQGGFVKITNRQLAKLKKQVLFARRCNPDGSCKFHPNSERTQEGRCFACVYAENPAFWEVDSSMGLGAEEAARHKAAGGIIRRPFLPADDDELADACKLLLLPFPAVRAALDAIENPAGGRRQPQSVPDSAPGKQVLTP